MENATWIAQKNYLEILVKKLSDLYGRDDERWLKEYFNELVHDNKDCLDKPIFVFLEMIKDAENVIKPLGVIDDFSCVCNKCGYRPPFCRFDLGEECTNTLK